MARGSRPPDQRRQRTIEAVVMFTALMHAHERGELSRVEEAQRALDRMGIVVRFAPAIPLTPTEGVTRG
jgi:hypothetical protein